jgi:hypothetical protein
MPSKLSSAKENEITMWLDSNSQAFLDPMDKIEKVIFLKGTIKNDLRVSGFGITLDHRYEIQPKAVFITSNDEGDRNLGIVEISSTAVGLKDIGVLHAYAKMVVPKYALLLCENSFSKELTYLLTNPIIGPRLLEYAASKQLQLMDFNYLS